MKKVFLSFLTFLLFAGYGIAQTGSSSTIDEKVIKQRAQAATPSISAPQEETSQDQGDFTLNESEELVAKPKVAIVEISTDERAFIDDLKANNVEEYKEYLRTKSDIKSLEKSLANSENMDENLKNQLRIKLEGLKSKYDF